MESRLLFQIGDSAGGRGGGLAEGQIFSVEFEQYIFESYFFGPPKSSDFPRAASKKKPDPHPIPQQPALLT